ncbi:MAG: GNAT family N-acetyltransferase [Oscillospiraceae bacterium]|nr:GNAT family N-acetyltransferase [Oscillospiraceae bacterium]
MEQTIDGFLISDDKNLLQIDRVYQMLQTTYWAKARPLDVVQRAIASPSLAFGVYLGDMQIGFARVVTDFATLYYLCDVVIENAYRRRGLGKALVRFIVEREDIKNLLGLLHTNDAHGLYEQYGFAKDPDKAMIKARPG